jgi:predicted transcriptional regulator
MVKKSFTTRLDEQVMALAQQIAAADRRSVTAVIELAVIEYGMARGFSVSAPIEEAAGET